MEGQQPAYEYGVWSMLGTLSTFAARRYWFPFGPLTYYPNLYVVLVGDPGNGKSTAMNRGKNIVRMSKITPVAATQITKEALTQKMADDKFQGKKFFEYDGNTIEYNQYAIFATELVEFIAVNPQGFLDFLTTVWDEPQLEVETKNKGHHFVKGPNITMLACMTPEKLKGFMKQSILTGGFARRCAFMYSREKNIVPFPSYSDSQRAAEMRCVEFGKSLQEHSGPFDWTQELKDFYKDWYIDNEKRMNNRPPNVRGWYQSKGEMLFKLSMLIALAEHGGERRIMELSHYQKALEYCDMLEKTLPKVFEGSGINPNSAAATQILNMLEALGKPMVTKRLEAMFFDETTSYEELKSVIKAQVSFGRLHERTITVSLGNSVPYAITLVGTPEAFAGKSETQLAIEAGLMPEPQQD